MTVSRMLVLLVSLGLLPAASAQVSIYRCKDRRGHVVMQNAPCTATQRTVGQRDFPTPVDTPEAVLRRQEIAREMAQRNAALHLRNEQTIVFNNGPQTSETTKADRCRAARAHRDAVLRQVGLHRTFDLLRHLDDQVYQACK